MTETAITWIAVVAVACNSAIATVLIVFLFKWFPRIVHGTAYTAAVKRKLEPKPTPAEEEISLAVVEDDAGAKAMMDDKPLGVDGEVWQRATEMATMTGRPIDDCLRSLTEREENADRGMHPIGLGAPD